MINAQLRLGVIGAGQHSRTRVLPAITRLPNVRLAAICDLAPARSAGAASQYAVPSVYTDYRELFASANLDAVAICAGPQVHTQLSIEAMRVGLPVFIEKPPAVSAAAAAEIWSVSRHTGRICMVGFRKRFATAYRKANAIVGSLEFGAPTLLSILRSSGPFAEDPDLPTTWFLLDFAIHVIDLARYMCGEVVEVFAWKVHRSTYAVNLRFANGALGVLALTADHGWASCEERVEITSAARHIVQIEYGVELK